MKTTFRLAAFLAVACAALRSNAGVVINEILYHAPADIDDLQFVELHNPGDAAVDLSGWAFTKGVKFTFPKGAKIDAGGFVVVARNADRFKEFYNLPIAGAFEGGLGHKGERLVLSDASGKKVDGVHFRDQAPWPSGAAGLSGSLERIAPSASSDDPANWISSPLSADREKPAGTPGKRNAGFQPQLPPAIASVRFEPSMPSPGQKVRVEKIPDVTRGLTACRRPIR